MVKQRSLIESLILDEREDDDDCGDYEQGLHITRGECPTPDANGLRVCPWVSCRHHLALDVSTFRRGSERLLLHPFLIDESGDLALDSGAPMCSLDVADIEALSLNSIGALMGSSHENMRRLERSALIKLRESGELDDFKSSASARTSKALAPADVQEHASHAAHAWLVTAKRLRAQMKSRRPRLLASHVVITRCLLAQMLARPRPKPKSTTPDASSFTRAQWGELLLHKRIAMVRYHCELPVRIVSRFTRLKEHVIKSVEAGRINIDAQAARSLLAAYGLTRADIESDEAPQTKYLRMHRHASSDVILLTS